MNKMSMLFSNGNMLTIWQRSLNLFDLQLHGEKSDMRYRLTSEQVAETIAALSAITCKVEHFAAFCDLTPEVTR